MKTIGVMVKSITRTSRNHVTISPTLTFPTYVLLAIPAS